MRRLMFRAILDNRLMMAEAGTDGEGGTGGAGGGTGGTGDGGTGGAGGGTGGTGDGGTGGTGDGGTGGTGDGGTGGTGDGAGNGTGDGGTSDGTGEDGITSAIAQKTGKDGGTSDGETGKDGKTGDGGAPAIDAETSKIADEEYSKAMVADEETKKLAADERIELSPELVTGMLPHLKAAGVKPEQAAQLANSLAREQIKAEKKRVAERVESCKRLNAEAMKLYPAESDWKLIGAGVARFFKPGSPMHYTITHSELGSDPEFLALMKYVGERVQADGAAGASSGTGGGKVAVNMAKALGIE